MKILSSVLALTLLVCINPARAFELVFNFSTNNAPIFDSGGTYSTNAHGGHQEYTVHIAPNGKITGPFTATLDEDGAQLSFDGSVSGLVRGSTVVLTPDDFRMSMNLRARFTGTVNGIPVKGVQTARARLKPDASMQFLVGEQTIKVCIAGHGCRNTSSSLEIPVSGSSSTPGDWSLTLNTTNSSAKIAGTALVTLSNLRSFDFKVRGKAIAAKSNSRLVLTGTGEAKGIVLTMELSPANDLLSIRGRLLGQRFDWHAQP